ncbi:MAG: hypothetical protein JWL85_151, partial [Candidatus Saccharibacteria bacterium]|nr:hypothetical protein [Candidatus Saccharibacteria bacterium]
SGINGTSFATPFVGGMLTRLLSQQPDATPLQLIAAITENTNRLSLPATTPQSSTLGHGTVDSLKATLRMSTPLSMSQRYDFLPVSLGNYLLPSETPGTYAVHACQEGTVGSSPVYELTKANDRFFTVSRAELHKAITSGYAASLLAYACLEQPHDTPTVMRNINIFNEFRNIVRPLQ